MKCPACENELTQTKAGSLTVDACQDGCGGIWFDHFELSKVDEPAESAGAELLNVTKNPNVQVNHEKRYSCPKCLDVIMMRHYFSVKRRALVDECPKCAGYFLDAGELGVIRSLFNSEAEARASAQAYFSELFGSKLTQMLQESESESAKANKIQSMFRFICPSYYVDALKSLSKK
jgi:Zn-finger nucleic acid-binding protein